MRAMVVRRPGPIDSNPLHLVERDPPQPGPDEIQVRVEVCGVCRTDLHVVEGDLRPERDEIVPGHEVVGRVSALGQGAKRFRDGDRVVALLLRSRAVAQQLLEALRVLRRRDDGSMGDGLACAVSQMKASGLSAADVRKFFDRALVIGQHGITLRLVHQASQP